MMALYDPNENQDVMGNGSGLAESERIPQGRAGLMPIEDTTEFEAGGSQAAPRAPLTMGLMADLNKNGIPDGAEVTFKQNRDDGTTITARFKQAMPLMEESLPKYQPGPAPRAPGMPFDPNGSMAPYNSLGPMAQARMFGNRTLEDQRAFVQDRESQYRTGIRNEADRKMAYDLAKTEALTKFGGGLMALEGTGVKADATTDAALFRALGTGAMADAKRYSSDNYYRGVQDKVAGGIVERGMQTQGNIQQQELRNTGAADVARINNEGRRDVADANNQARAAQPLLVRDQWGAQQVLVPNGDGTFRIGGVVNTAPPGSRPQQPGAQQPQAKPQGDDLPTYTAEQARNLVKGTRFRSTDGRILTKN